jgi:hypothetical protein
VPRHTAAPDYAALHPGYRVPSSLPEDAFDIVEHALRQVSHEFVGIVPQWKASGWAAEVVFDDIDPGKKARWFFFANLVNFAQSDIDLGG